MLSSARRFDPSAMFDGTETAARRNLREGGTRTFEGWGRDTKWNTSLFHLTIASAAVFMTDVRLSLA